MHPTMIEHLDESFSTFKGACFEVGSGVLTSLGHVTPRFALPEMLSHAVGCRLQTCADVKSLMTWSGRSLKRSSQTSTPSPWVCSRTT